MTQESRADQPARPAQKEFEGLRDWLTLGLAAQVSAIPVAESGRSLRPGCFLLNPAAAF